jgi:hypothetical protein
MKYFKIRFAVNVVIVVVNFGMFIFTSSIPRLQDQSYVFAICGTIGVLNCLLLKWLKGQNDKKANL